MAEREKDPSFEPTLPQPDARTPDAAATGDEHELPVVDPVHYAVEGEHARGGLGRILRARDRRLGRTVAVKELLDPDGGGGGRFVREALLTARLEHPSIVPVHEAGRWPDGRPFYAMKLVSGRSLAEVIRGARTLDERLALLPTVIAAAEAVAYAHAKRIIHRDLKPANVLVGSFGETLVVDWGLAKDLAQPAPEATPTPTPTPEDSLPPDDASDLGPDGATVAGAVIGTPAYMSPEQAAGQPADERSDVYALGALLYATLAGAAPYQAATPMGTVVQVVEGPPKPLGERQPGVPEELLTIVAKAMARRPADRYATASELAEDLKRFQTGRLVAAHRYSRWTLARRWLRRNRVPVTIAAAAVAALAAVGTVSVARVVRERDRADRERADAVRQRAAAEEARAREAARVDELTVSQARARLDDDPTAAVAWLKRLRAGSPRWPAARVIAEAAAGRGVARRLLRHEEALADAAFAPDGSLLATAARDGSVRLWPLPAGAPRALVGPHAAVARVAFSSDGRALYAAAGDGLWRWDTAGGAGGALARDALEDLALSPDGKLAAAVGRDGAVRLYELDGGMLRAAFAAAPPVRAAFAPDGRTLALRGADGIALVEIAGGRRRALDGARGLGGGAIAFASDGRWLAAGADGKIALWELPSGAARTLAAAGGAVTLLAPSPDGKSLAAANEDGTVRLWDVASGKPIELAHKGDPARDLRFSPDGKRVAATRGAMVRVWTPAQPGEVRKLRGHELDAVRIAFSRDGTQLASASLDQTARLWSLAVGEPQVAHLAPPAPSAFAVAVAPDGRRYAAARAGALWLGEAGAPPRAIAGVAAAEVAFSSDGKTLAAAGPQLALVDAAGAVRNLGRARRVAWLPDGRLLSGGDDGALTAWDAGRPRELGRHRGAVTDLAVAPDGRAFASAGADGAVRLWDADGKATPLADRTRAARVAFSPDGKWLAAGGADDDVLLWSLPGGERRALRVGGPLADLAFSSDGTLAAAAAGSRRVQLWDLVRNVGSDLAVDDAVTSLAFLPGGALLAVGSRNGALVLRDLPTGEGWPLVGHRAAVVALARSADGALLASAGEDGQLRLWPDAAPADPDALQRWMAALTDARIGRADRLTGE